MAENKYLLFTIGTLIAVVIGMVSFWMLEGRSYVSRDEVTTLVTDRVEMVAAAKMVSRNEIARMIAETAPYVKDQRMIEAALIQNERTQVQLTAAIDELSRAMVKLTTMLEEQEKRRP